jgi:hypothetical protein
VSALVLRRFVAAAVAGMHTYTWTEWREGVHDRRSAGTAACCTSRLGLTLSWVQAVVVVSYITACEHVSSHDIRTLA